MDMSSPDHFAQVNISFPVKFSALMGGVLAALTLWFYFEAQSAKETFVFFAVGAAAVGQITTSFFTARLLGSTMQSAERDLKREKLALEREDKAAKREAAHDAFILRREALRFGERWNNPAMSHARDILRGISDCKGKNPNELLVFIEQNETAVSHILNFVEEIATNCRHEVVDVEIMKRQFDFVVVDTWRSLVSWIHATRDRHGDDIWEDSEWLYNLWK
jgi:hypothetical protein